MQSSSCPICQITIPIHSIQRHVNSHFEDDELDSDMKLAQQISLAPQFFESASEMAPESSTSRDHQSSINGEPKDIDRHICRILSLQQRAAFHRVEAGLMTLLRKCLECENSTSMLSGYVDHFQSTKSEDMGWGCGWRNIQMISSHLLKERQEAREILFGSSGFVPDIGSLQRWLEVAWQKGFDIAGSSFFEGKIYGSKKWIGTTECATLLRSFGLRAKIVDFDSNSGKKSVGQVCGPMDKFVVRRESNTGKDVEKFHDCSTQNNKGYQALVDWVWSYFAKCESTRPGLKNVIVTNKMPLYFQHQGHSRTIIGIQVNIKSGVKHYNLLVLDPAHSTKTLERSLIENVGWQRFLKRGVHTLKKPQYQLCYVDSGVARGEEMEQLKTLNSALLEC